MAVLVYWRVPSHKNLINTICPFIGDITPVSRDITIRFGEMKVFHWDHLGAEKNMV